jgi:thioredoxin 1
MSSELIKHLTDETFEAEISKGVTLVDFNATWCGPCRMLSPILEEVAEFFKGKAHIAKVDIDSEQDTAAEYKVSSVPTLILFKDGEEVDRLIGLRDADSIKEFIENIL